MTSLPSSSPAGRKAFTWDANCKYSPKQSWTNLVEKSLLGENWLKSLPSQGGRQVDRWSTWACTNGLATRRHLENKFAMSILQIKVEFLHNKPRCYFRSLINCLYLFAQHFNEGTQYSKWYNILLSRYIAIQNTHPWLKHTPEYWKEWTGGHWAGSAWQTDRPLQELGQALVQLELLPSWSVYFYRLERLWHFDFNKEPQNLGLLYNREPTKTSTQ